MLFGLHCFLFAVMVLLVEFQRYCGVADAAASDIPTLNTGGYITEWLFQVLFTGGLLAMAALRWGESVYAVRKHKPDTKLSQWPWWLTWKVEAIIVFFPLVVTGILIVLLVKGPDACGNCECMRGVKWMHRKTFGKLHWVTSSWKRNKNSTEDVEVGEKGSQRSTIVESPPPAYLS